MVFLTIMEVMNNLIAYEESQFHKMIMCDALHEDVSLFVA